MKRIVLSLQAIDRLHTLAAEVAKLLDADVAIIALRESGEIGLIKQSSFTHEQLLAVATELTNKPSPIQKTDDEIRIDPSALQFREPE